MSLPKVLTTSTGQPLTTTKTQFQLVNMDLLPFLIFISSTNLLTSTEKEFPKELFMPRELVPTATSKLPTMSLNTPKPKCSNLLGR